MWAGVNANPGRRDGRKEGSNEYKQDGGLLGLVRERRGDKGLMSAYGFVAWQTGCANNRYGMTSIPRVIKVL